ncbi:MAG: hypothetical protein IIA91_02790 [Chloroflexi bacterium]|nr:hypothetical protein [Chloroflexota bacterium]
MSLTDYSGRKRQGRALLLSEWPSNPGSEHLAEGEDFRIVVLSEPPEGTISPEEGVVVVAPGRRLASATVTARKPSATYNAAEQANLALSAKNIERLRQGSLVAATPLQLTAEDVFAGGKARLALLACDLLLSIAVAEYLSPIAIALSAPDAAKPVTLDRLEELKQLVSAVSDNGIGDGNSELKKALDHLSELTCAAATEQFLASAERIYPNKRALMEEIYMLRALRKSPLEANELLSMRRFLQRAVLPAEETELSMDRTVVLEQFAFATLAVEPQRYPSAKAMADSFRRKYVSSYREHHTRYWADMARLHTGLREEQPHTDALRRLNTLTELGPPAGVKALATYGKLMAETAGCPLVGGVEEMLETEAVCPDCGLSLDQTAPTQRVDEVLSHIDRACHRQMSRLSSSAVQQMLRNSNDARVDQFLKVVQASQLSSLSDILDDDLIGYLRRFLVEGRIETALRPIFDQLQEGVTPKVDEAKTAMREVSQILQRAFQAAQRALPPAETTVTSSPPPRRKRKR